MLFNYSKLPLHNFVNRSISIYVCQNCGAETRQFFGRCSSCGEWNSIVEEIVSSSNMSLIFTDLKVESQKPNFFFASNSNEFLRIGLNFDKKILNNNINFILLNNIGNAYIEKNIDNKLIIESIKYIK